MLHRNLLPPFSGFFYPDDISRREYSSKALEASYRLHGITYVTLTRGHCHENLKSNSGYVNISENG